MIPYMQKNFMLGYRVIETHTTLFCAKTNFAYRSVFLPPSMQQTDLIKANKYIYTYEV